MAANEKETFGQRFASGKALSANTPLDTIKGWNDRRKSNNQVITSMVPFVQLIGLFDEKEYEKMFSLTNERVPVGFDDGSKGAIEYNQTFKGRINYNSIRAQIAKRFIDVYILKSVDHGLSVDPIEGIVMAEAGSQVKPPSEGGDPSGGIGITDLQVDYGKSNILGSRKFVLRMTINDPKILDERFEYSKLATFGGEFLIIYGWSNPEVIPGYDAPMSPPKLEANPLSTTTPPRQRLIVPIRNLGNGGYWSAGRVNISNYDFGFNEMGKLEITITLRDDSTLGMSSTVVSSIARKFKLFLQGDLFGQLITDAAGNEFTLRDALYARQQDLNKQYQEANAKGGEGMSYQEYSRQWQAATEYADDVLLDNNNKTLEEALPGGSDQPYTTEEEIQKQNEEINKPQKGWPDQNAIYTYKQIYETVLDTNPSLEDEEVGGEIDDKGDEVADQNQVPSAAVPTKQVIGYEKRAAYYFLGAIMDSVSLCMADVKVGVGGSKVPSFYYHPISEDSKLSTVFQSNLQSVNRTSSYEERIQEAVIRLKERFLPPAPRTHDSPYENRQELLAMYRSVLGSNSWLFYAMRDRYQPSEPGQPGYVTPTTARGGRGQGVRQANTPSTRQQRGTAGARGGRSTTTTREQQVQAGNQIKYADRWEDETWGMAEAVAIIRGVRKTSTVSGTSPTYEGLQTPAKTAALRRARPAPPNVEHMIGAPMRGHLETVQTDEGSLTCFIPDWKQEKIFDEEGNETESSGSPDGYDPLNPSEYKAADQGGKFYIIQGIKRSDLTNSSSNATINFIFNYDDWRLADTDTWNLLQRKWHNLYIEYLGTYFEHLIRKRVTELETFGIPIEFIYNEPLDLDWLTGKIYNNNAWQGENRDAANFLFSWADVAGKYAEGFDLSSEEGKLNEKISISEDIIAQNNKAIDGFADTNPQAVLEGRVPAGLRSTALALTRRINILKSDIELLTGGLYERSVDGIIVTNDIMGNTIMLRFKNFSYVAASQEEDAFSFEAQLVGKDENGVPIETQIAVINPIIQYEYQSKPPEVKEEWVLWSEYNVPTNNFQNWWDESIRAFVDPANKAEKWKQENSYAYETGVLSKVESSKVEVRNLLNTISRLQNQLNDIYNSYQEHKNAIENAQTKIGQAQGEFEQFKEFFNDEGKIQLSIYDDTSDFDGDGIKVPMGRDQPMHLTTKVAQQWARRFQRAQRRGAMDVRNYGPPLGGKQYYLPSNNYNFKFDINRRLFEIVGNPKRVVDPGYLKRRGLDNPALISLAGEVLLRNLSNGFNSGDDATQILSVNLPLVEYNEGRFTIKLYDSWRAFGSPGIPNENGNNEWGFKYGPPTETELEGGYVELAGGNYVRSYKDFLNLFGLAYNPDWPSDLKIVGDWPAVRYTESIMKEAGLSEALAGVDRNLLLGPDQLGTPVYTMIDEIGNIIVDDDKGWYRPTGWYLEFAGKPVFLYPSRRTATKINNSSDVKDGVQPGGVLQTGGLTLIAGGGGLQRIDLGPMHKMYRYGGGTEDDGHLNGRKPRAGQAVADFIADFGKNWWEGTAALFTGDFETFIKSSAGSPVGFMAMAGGHFESGSWKALRGQHIKKMNDGIPTDYKGGKPAWGGRIGMGQHCPNLTLDMKRSMILLRFSTSQETNYLGDDLAGGGHTQIGPDNYQIDWSQLIKDGEYWIIKDSDPVRYATYDRPLEIVDGKERPAKGSHVTGPKINKNNGYSNPKYPYGTGFYGMSDTAHGPFVFPEINKNWIDWGDLLYALGKDNGYGFFTQVDNRNYSPCIVQPDGSITDGLEINDGFVKFLIENVFAPLPKNRRCGARTDHKPIVIMSGQGRASVQNFHMAKRLDDVTYGDLFGPLRDKSEDDQPVDSALDPAAFGNIDNFNIDSIANIPIRSQVIDNLVNKNNTNMSITQFFGEILRPGAIGVNNVVNPRVAMKQATDGTFEVFSLSDINWDKMSEDYKHLFTNNLGEDEEKIRFPEDVVVLDFRAQDSLIESIDMNSTFDPLIARAFRDAALDFGQTADKLLQFLSYKDIAPELKAYLELNHPELQGEVDGETNEAIKIEADGKVTLNRKLFVDDSGITTDAVTTAITKFLQDNPARMNSLRALLNATQSGETTPEGEATTGKNYATQLMSNYMRKTTITIHGTTNISPFQKVIVKGVMPDLEGMYLITNTRESITPQGFQTILEGSLIRPPSGKRVDIEPIAEQTGAVQFDPPKDDVETVLDKIDDPVSSP